MTTTEQLQRYRERHIIAWYENDGRKWCAHDGIRVVPRFGRKLGQGFRHDPDEIRRLVKGAMT